MPDRPHTIPIDETARDGRYRLLLGDNEFAVARWDEDRWVFSNGVELHFMPTSYHPIADRKARAA